MTELQLVHTVEQTQGNFSICAIEIQVVQLSVCLSLLLSLKHIHFILSLSLSFIWFIYLSFLKFLNIVQIQELCWMVQMVEWLRLIAGGLFADAVYLSRILFACFFLVNTTVILLSCFVVVVQLLN